MSRGSLSETVESIELTLAEWFDMPEDQAGELVDGRLVEEEAPNCVHEILVILLGSVLRQWVAVRGGFVGGSDAKFAVGPRGGRKPDLTVYLPGSPLPPTSGVIRVPPDIAVEIVSPSPRDGRRDRIEKVAEYASFGIRQYWIVDPTLRSVEFFELGSDESYRYALGATAGIVESVPGCEGLVLDLDLLWAEIDRLEAQIVVEPGTEGSA